MESGKTIRIADSLIVHWPAYVRWIHDYQDACVDKLERFMRGEINSKQIDAPGVHRHAIPHGLPPTPGTPQIRSPSQQRRSCSVDNGRTD